MARLTEILKAAVKIPLQTAACIAGPQARWRKPEQPALWILMYHRILPASDPRHDWEEPGMIVTPDTFAEHLRQVKQLFTPVSLPQWVDDYQQGKALPAKACAITFDDGWRDNYEYAFPVLQQQQCPATIFLVADYIGSKRQFWPNRLAQLLLQHSATLQQPCWQWLRQISPSLPTQFDYREQLSAVINDCKRQTDQWLHQQLDQTEQQLTAGEEPASAMLDWQQIEEMQRSGLVSFGSHTLSHQRLTESLAKDQLHAEIINSQTTLQQQLQQSVNTFCYPNGDLCEEALDLVGSHYQAAVTTRRGINRQPLSLARLHRIGVHEDISNTPRKFQARLSDWL